MPKPATHTAKVAVLAVASLVVAASPSSASASSTVLSSRLLTVGQLGSGWSVLVKPQSATREISSPQGTGCVGAIADVDGPTASVTFHSDAKRPVIVKEGLFASSNPDRTVASIRQECSAHPTGVLYFNHQPRPKITFYESSTSLGGKPAIVLTAHPLSSRATERYFQVWTTRRGTVVSVIVTTIAGHVTLSASRSIANLALAKIRP